MTEEEFNQRHVDPLAPFYLALIEANNDGTLDLCCETPAGFATEAGALAYLRQEFREHGALGYVFRCEPQLSVTRGSPKVRRIAGSPQ